MNRDGEIKHSSDWNFEPQHTPTPDEQAAAKELVETLNSSDLSAEEKQEQVYSILTRG